MSNAVCYPPAASATARGIARFASPAEVQAEAGSLLMSPSVAKYLPNTSKAWVSFNGTGTVAIYDSYNVSSITDNGTGDFTINFTTAMNSANYAVQGMVGFTGQGRNKNQMPLIAYNQAPAAGNVRVHTCYDAGSGAFFDDPTYCMFSILAK